MRTDISHIVLTRFNLAINFQCKKREDSTVPLKKPWLEEEYLEKRFQIFEKYTYPSFAAQTDKNFKWIVLFHKDTPRIFKDRIQKLANEMEQMEAWFWDDEECRNCAANIKEYISKNYPDKGVITTRVDNDDLVHKTFIETIKKDIYSLQETQVLTYVNGLQYDSRSRELVKYDYANNHFLSLYVIDTSGENHILGYDHSAIDRYVEEKGLLKTVRKTKVPLWVEVITETNYSNSPRWRFSALMVPYRIAEEYPALDIRWHSKIQWCGYIILGVGKVFVKRGMGLFRIIMENIVRRND